MNATRRFASWFGPAVLLALVFAIPADRAIGADRALWLRYPAISPDGKTLSLIHI